jgi:molecular chaperone DnaK
MSNKKVMGIDLGTGNSAVAVIENGKSKVIENNEGHKTTPSVVFVKGDERKVGAPAKRGMVMNPKNTVSFIKRFMGATYNDPDVQRMLEMITYNVKNVNGKPYVDIDGKEYSPEQISSIILGHMQSIAKDYYGTDTKDVVITCPAWFNDVQRQATKLAGELAGLNVLRIINEPTAAILASDIDTKSGDKIVLVNDSGCGTQDVSICEVSEGMVEVLASYGDVFLGGQNFDQRIVDWVVEEFKKEKGIDLSKDQMAYARIVEAAEKAKCELSSTTQTEINLPYITVADGVPQMLVTTLTRAKFEQLTADLVDRVVDCAREALNKAGKTNAELSEILLVGGSSRIPAIQDALTRTFNVPLNKTANFDEAVALGAAIQANTIVGGEGSEDSVLLLDVTPISLGIEVNGNQMHRLIEANTTIPTQKKEVFTTAVDNQPAVSIVVLQGERPMSADNKHIGTFNLDGILPARRGVPQIEVTFDIDANGILSVSAKDLGTGKEQHITINNSNSLSEEEINKIKADAEAFKAEDERRMKEIEEINMAERYLFAVKTFLDESGDKVTEDEKTNITALADELDKVLPTRNLEDIKKAHDALSAAWEPVVQRIYAENAPKQEQHADGQQVQNPFENIPGNPFGAPQQ